MSQDQVDGMDAILDEWDIRHIPRPEYLAYMLATTKWETASTMHPIREYGRGKGRKYGRKDATTGQVYYGRGFVQLTWAANYQKAGKKLGVDFYRNPDLVMELGHATKILFDGMIEGWFTGKKLSHYITGNKADYVGARRIINGTDKAKTIANIAVKFRKAIRELPETADVEDEPQPDDLSERVNPVAAAIAALVVAIGGALGISQPDFLTSILEALK